MTSEKRSLVRFMLLYSFSTLLLISILAAYFYSNQKKQILDNQQKDMQSYATEFVGHLTEVHQYTDDTYYPQHKNFRSAIYDSEKKLIFSDFTPKKINWDKSSYLQDDKLMYIKHVKPYFLGTAFLVIAKKVNSEELVQLENNMLIILSVTFFIILLLSYFLGRQFIKPMRQSIELLDNFINDTTHELNTPVSIILTNIEAASTIKKDEKLTKYMNRLEIAARTISNLYDSLIFLKLNHLTNQEDETFNLSLLLKERLEYFELHFESRKIELILNIKDHIGLFANQENIRRLIDNLLSNAIKYNHRAGTITIILNDDYLIVKDSGIGIPNDKLNLLFKRFTRIKNNSEGGFGLGLHIVKMITDKYKYKLEIESEEDKGTMVKIAW